MVTPRGLVLIRLGWDVIVLTKLHSLTKSEKNKKIKKISNIPFSLKEKVKKSLKK